MKEEERSKQGQANNKAKQHSTPKAVTFPKKNELPRVGTCTCIYMYINTLQSRHTDIHVQCRYTMYCKCTVGAFYMHNLHVHVPEAAHFF